MRFITEFELVPPAIIERINAYKTNASFELGNSISDSFGWKCKGEATLKAIGSELKERHTLEIEAFPMDKWVEFKNKLRQYIINCEDDDILPCSLDVIKMFQELESFGKPSVDAITNQQSDKKNG